MHSKYNRSYTRSVHAQRPAGPGSNNGSGLCEIKKYFDVAVLIDSALLRASGQCKA